MSHPAQRQFCHEVKQRFPQFFTGTRVLEIGSRDVNGSIRDEFKRADFVGVDCQSGPGVDVVAFGHQYVDAPESFDVVCSTETLEHDPFAAETVPHMSSLLRPGGLLLLTCAGEGRAEHGTSRTGARYGPESDFYRNVSVGEFLRWCAAGNGTFSTLYIEHDPAAGDLYFWGIKSPARSTG